MKRFFLFRILLITALLVGVAGSAFLLSYKDGPVIFFKRQYYKLQEKRDYQDLADLCLEGTDRDNHALVFDTLRHCVHMNTQHNINEEYERLAAIGQRAFLHSVAEYKRGKRGYPPPLECSRRSMVLDGLYKFLGYQSRTVLLAENVPGFPDHVMVEVYNPDEKAWKIQGPMYDVHLKSLATGERIGFEEFLKQSPESLVPCRFDGECGWALQPVQTPMPVVDLKKYGAVAHLNHYARQQGPLLYNPDRIDLTASGYCEKYADQCAAAQPVGGSR